MTRRLTPQVALVPLRRLIAVSPSGVAIYFSKFTESDRELSWGCGNVTAIEHTTFWKAKLAAERPGVEHWEKARALLVAAGWQIGQETHNG